MAGSDDEFEEFLNRRKAVFQRPPDERFEPPAELDRLVLRQAREAIRSDEPMRVFSAPRWSLPITIAATLVLAFTIVFQAGSPTKPVSQAEVTVQNIADTTDPAQARSAVVESASRERSVAGSITTAPAMASAPVADGAEPPAWRRDAKSWLAEIERLREAGDAARAETEFAEYKRQQRAYAVAPDR